MIYRSAVFLFGGKPVRIVFCRGGATVLKVGDVKQNTAVFIIVIITSNASLPAAANYCK